MLEILQDFESAIGQGVRLSPLIFVGPGLAAVVVGLFIWLGGLGFKKLLVAVAGAICGGICGFFAIGQNIVSAAFAAVLAAALAMVFERLFIAILTAALAAAFAFVVLAGPYVENSQQAAPISLGEISIQDPAISTRESAEKMKAYIIDAVLSIKHAGLQMPVNRWAIIMVLALIFIVAGFYLWRLASALCCSVLGTTLIFAGMILLLLYKGALPVNIICSKSSYYATAFIAMIAFGTSEQLLFCKRSKTRSAGKRQIGKNEQEPDRKKENWRTA